MIIKKVGKRKKHICFYYFAHIKTNFLTEKRKFTSFGPIVRYHNINMGINNKDLTFDQMTKKFSIFHKFNFSFFYLSNPEIRF